jgi:hypothetical protein
MRTRMTVQARRVICFQVITGLVPLCSMRTVTHAQRVTDR